jgi:FG-GAP-like repeat/RTX calcium-binding nonapeptide repeat (4 copies)
MTTVYADAYGFNASDATTALQAAIDSGADRVIVRNQGTPWLISKTIQLKSNQEIRFEPDVVVRAKSGSFLKNDLPLFQALGINNIKLVGEGEGVRQATLAMNKNEFSVTSNSYGHIIGIEGTDNFTISGLTLTGAGGDGIIVDAYSYGQPIPVPNTLNYSDHGLIDNVTAINNRRNGLSVISAQNLIIQNSKFINSSDENPATGIDFEPDFSYNRLSNIIVSNVDISGNQGNGLSFSLTALDNNSTPTSITIDGATIDNNGSTGIKVETYQTPTHPNSNNPNSTPNGVINISNVTIAGTKETTSFANEPNAAISVQALSGDLSDPNNLKVNFTNVAISNTGFNTANPQLSAEPIFIRGFGGASNRNQIGNLSFDNVTVADNFNRDIIGVYLNQTGSFNNITGNIKGINPNGVTANITPTNRVTRNNFTLTVTPTISPVVGTGGNDTFTPGKGAIAIDGKAGTDTLILDNSADIANTTITYTTPSNGKIVGGFNQGMTFQNIESVIFTSGSGKADINVAATTGSNKINIAAATGTNSITSGIGADTIGGSVGADTLIGGGGADKLSGGAGNDTYVVDRALGGGTIIDDLSGANDTLTLIGNPNLTTTEISRSGTTLLIDLNQNSVFDPAIDLSIKNFFANDTGRQAGTGLIENIGNLNSTTILNSYPATRNDFNGDGKADILWRNDYGSVALWQMAGATVTSGSLTSSPFPDPSWTVAATSDYNGDGKSDVLWRNTNGAIAVWTMDGATVTASTLASTPSLDPSWIVAGTGDYSGDGKSDILWRNTNGAIAVWTMDGATVTASALTSTPSLESDWKIAGNGDFNGDGKSDILWRNDNGSVALWQMNGAEITASTTVAKLATDWQIAGTGDFNGDRKTDILWRNNDGRVVLWQMDGATIVDSSLTSTPSRDSSQTIAGIDDYNGDTKADILWRKDTGAVEIWQMNGATVVASTLTSVAADGNTWKVAAPIV